MAEGKNINHIKHDDEPPAQRRKGWTIAASEESQGAVNTVRLCEERHFKEVVELRNKEKDLIKLSIGDPTVFGNLPPHPVITEALKNAVDEGKYNGYSHSSGVPHVREVVAKKFSVINQSPLTAEDVIMASACSGALDIAISALTNPGQNVLTPSPGFGIYRCLLGAKNVEQRLYRTQPDKDWEVDLEDMERLIDSNTVAIIINNPSNPCGSVYSKAHLKDIADFAAKHYLPIISDEIYADMVFSGHTFHSIAAVASNVPVLVCGGTAKKYLIPGWRLGWILIHDPIGAFDDELREGLSNVAMKLLGPSTVVQAAIADILTKTPDDFHQRNIAIFEENAKEVYAGLQPAIGLKPIMPAGAMYMMVAIEIDHFPEFKDDIDFTKQLVLEQSVFCLPGWAMECTNFFRVVLVMPKEKIAEACQRIVLFCQQHYKQ